MSSHNNSTVHFIIHNDHKWVLNELFNIQLSLAAVCVQIFFLTFKCFLFSDEALMVGNTIRSWEVLLAERHFDKCMKNKYNKDDIL